MNDIIRKQMNDVIVPHNDIVRRGSTVPEPYIAPKSERDSDYIEKNPFFEKDRRANRAAQKVKEAGSGRATKKASSRALLWAFVAVALLTGGFVIANYFSSATVEITPTTQSLNIDKDFTAQKDTANGDFVFKFMSLTEEKTKDVPATIEKKLQKKASGKVLIFNAYNGEKQRLIKNTRLESADHKIFRIDESVVVPGATIVGGKVTVPGSVEAVVYADVSGKEYNIGLGDFTIPGFKGDPRYAKFTAKSKSDSPIAGGFSGTVKTPSDEAIAAAQEEIKQDLKKTAVEKARAQIPDGVSFFPGSVIIKFEEVPQEFTTDDTAKVTVRATVSVFFFDTIILMQKLAETLPVEYKGKTFVVSNISALAFSFIDPVDNVVLSDLSKISFHIKGDAVFVGQIDTQKIRTELVGKEKNDFGKIIADQSSIDRADAVIRPMWKTVFPTDPAKITVKITPKEQ